MELETRARVALENAADLQPGKQLTIKGQNASLVVKRHASGRSWVLWIDRPIGPPLHTRWADDMGQLLEDLEHFMRADCLPVGKVQGF